MLYRRFEGIWTHDERTVEQAYLILSQMLGKDYQPVRQREHHHQNDYIISIATNLVNQLEGSNLARAHSQRLATAITDVAHAVAAERSHEAILDNVIANLKNGFKARAVTLWQTIGSQIALAMLGIEKNSPVAPTVAPTPAIDIQWTVLDSTLDGIIVLSEQKTVRFMNNAAAHLLAIDDRESMMN